MASIKASAQTDAHRKAFDDHMLSVECHGDVFIGKLEDSTHSLIRRGQPIPGDLGLYSLRPPSAAPPPQSRLPVGSGLPVAVPVSDERAIFYDDKQHYRIVFCELGVPISSLTSVFQIYVTLARVLLGRWHCVLLPSL